MYLSSAYTKTIVALGGGAATAISAATGGAFAAGFATFLSTIGGANVDTSKGIYINMTAVKNGAGNYVMKGTKWGYQ